MSVSNSNFEISNYPKANLENYDNYLTLIKVKETLTESELQEAEIKIRIMREQLLVEKKIERNAKHFQQKFQAQQDINKKKHYRSASDVPVNIDAVLEIDWEKKAPRSDRLKKQILELEKICREQKDKQKAQDKPLVQPAVDEKIDKVSRKSGQTVVRKDEADGVENNVKGDVVLPVASQFKKAQTNRVVGQITPSYNNKVHNTKQTDQKNNKNILSKDYCSLLQLFCNIYEKNEADTSLLFEFKRARLSDISRVRDNKQKSEFKPSTVKKLLYNAVANMNNVSLDKTIDLEYFVKFLFTLVFVQKGLRDNDDSERMMKRWVDDFISDGCQLLIWMTDEKKFQELINILSVEHKTFEENTENDPRSKRIPMLATTIFFRSQQVKSADEMCKDISNHECEKRKFIYKPIDSDTLERLKTECLSMDIIIRVELENMLKEAKKNPIQKTRGLARLKV